MDEFFFHPTRTCREHNSAATNLIYSCELLSYDYRISHWQDERGDAQLHGARVRSQVSQGRDTVQNPLVVRRPTPSRHENVIRRPDGIITQPFSFNRNRTHRLNREALSVVRYADTEFQRQIAILYDAQKTSKPIYTIISSLTHTAKPSIDENSNDTNLSIHT